MSDEEKKVIEYFKRRISNKKTAYTSIYFKIEKLDVLINLIEKQSKEIEELKKEYERVRAGRNWLSEHISAQIATPELFDKLVEENYTSNNKIKAKIEEIDFMIKEINQGHLQKYTVGELLGAKRFLESLLEKGVDI